MVYEPSDQVDAQALRELLVSAVARNDEKPVMTATVVPISSAA
jgi:hypothetical protein